MHLDHDLLEIWRFQKIAFEKTFPATSDLTFGNSTLKKNRAQPSFRIKSSPNK